MGIEDIFQYANALDLRLTQFTRFCVCGEKAPKALKHLHSNVEDQVPQIRSIFAQPDLVCAKLSHPVIGVFAFAYSPTL